MNTIFSRNVLQSGKCYVIIYIYLIFGVIAVFNKKNKGLKAKLRTHIYIISVLSIAFVALSACVVTAVVNQRQMSRTISAQLSDCSSKLSSWLEEKRSLTEFIADEIVDRGYAENKEECLPFLQDCYHKRLVQGCRLKR